MEIESEVKRKKEKRKRRREIELLREESGSRKGGVRREGRKEGMAER